MTRMMVLCVVRVNWSPVSPRNDPGIRHTNNFGLHIALKTWGLFHTRLSHQDRNLRGTNLTGLGDDGGG